MISGYGDQSTTGIILHIIVVLHQRCLNCSECFQRHLMFYTCNYNIRVTHRNVIFIVYFTRIESTEGSSAGCSLFILSLHALALHLAVKILLNLSVWRFEHVYLAAHLSVVFPSRMPAGPHFVTQPILLVKTFLIFDINHQQNTKEVRPDWNDKNDKAQTTRPHITWKVFLVAQVAIFKEIFDQVRKI